MGIAEDIFKDEGHWKLFLVSERGKDHVAKMQTPAKLRAKRRLTFLSIYNTEILRNSGKLRPRSDLDAKPAADGKAESQSSADSSAPSECNPVRHP